MAKLFALFLLPLRLTGVLFVVLLGLALQISLFTWIHDRYARWVVKIWSQLMLLSLGVSTKVSHSNARLEKGALMVCNHISWLDILVLQVSSPAVFVAKNEIRSWPVLGWMVALAGTCFIERERRSALKSVHNTLTAQLLAKRTICIFPEGTTSDGKQLLPFHAGLLQAAIDAKTPLQPVCLRYSHASAAFVGDMSLATSLINVLKTPGMAVKIDYLPLIDSQTHNRQTLASQAYQQIAAAL